MAIVRELTTLLDFQLDASGVAKYEAAANKIKGIAVGIGKLFGIVFAATKVYETVDALIHAGKEANILVYQLTRMARAGDDINEVQKQLFQTAQDTGIEYTQTLETYKEFLNESKELNVSQDQLLKTTSNIFKALRLGAASPEAIHATMATFERSFRMGRMGRRQFGMLTDQAPELVNALSDALGKTREQLDEMAKDGDLTAKVLIDGLGRVLPKLDKDFAARPRKLGEAFNYAWNAAVKLSMQLWKLLSVNSQVAKGIIWLTDQVVKGLTAMTDALGGIGKVLELLEITLAVVFGPRLLTMIYGATVAMAGWAASTWLTVAGYAAIALAIAGVVLAIQDVIVWMRGGKSVIGDWVGPFEDVKKKFTETFTGLFDPIKQKMDSLGLTQIFVDVKQSLVELKDFVVAEFLHFWDDLNRSFGVTADETKKTDEALKSTKSNMQWLGDKIKYVVEQYNALIKAAHEAGAVVGKWLGIRGDKEVPIGEAGKGFMNWFIDNLNKSMKTSNDWGLSFNRLITGKDVPGQKTDPNAPSWFDKAFPNFYNNLGVTPGQVTGQVAPGVGAVGTVNQGDNTVNLNVGGVTVNTTDPDAAGALTKVFDNAAAQALEALARQTRNAAPRTEAPAQ
jgi:tape measure domain-containing protein